MWSYSGYTKRVIVHPSFMNVPFAEAERSLSCMDPGEAIFRPSSLVRVIISLQLWCVMGSVGF